MGRLKIIHIGPTNDPKLEAEFSAIVEDNSTQLEEHIWPTSTVGVMTDGTIAKLIMVNGLRFYYLVQVEGPEHKILPTELFQRVKPRQGETLIDQCRWYNENVAVNNHVEYIVTKED